MLHGAINFLEQNGHILIVAVYVDDLLIMGSDMEMITAFKEGMARRFEMSDLGKLNSYLGIEVTQSEGRIILSHERYARRILEEAGMAEFNAVHISMDSGLKLCQAKDERDANAKSYRRKIGCLRYLIHMHSDLSYCVGVLSRYMHAPKKSHKAALKQVLRYLQGSSPVGIVYDQKDVTELVGYSDSSNNVDPDDGKSTTGHIFSVLLLGVHRNKKLLHYHLVRLSLWQQQRLQNMRYGFRTYLARLA